MRRRIQPVEGEYVFQKIRRICEEEKSKGRKVLNLAWGQPEGSAMLVAREKAAQVIMCDDEQVHGYQNNGSPGVPEFARRFVQAHFDFSLECLELAYLPIPGIKSMLGLVQLACRPQNGNIKVAYMSDPGFPTPKDWGNFLRLDYYELPLNPDNKFTFCTQDVRPGTNLLMCNYMHNPSGQVYNRDQWIELIEYCIKNDIRIFNDNPYHFFVFNKSYCALTEVAKDFPKLSWVEAFSASKEVGNACGWRVGAMVGSPDFIADIAKVKADTDCGFSAPLAAGVICALETRKVEIQRRCYEYRQRILKLINILNFYGMILAQNPGGGLFILWHSPRFALGKTFDNADEFNTAMIQLPEIGIAGIPFGQYIRYAVTTDIFSMQDDIHRIFKEAEIHY
jgi:aspartate/methionine/tyrosine aminotransferase